MLQSTSCLLVNRRVAEYGLCMCSDGPRARLINEFSLPMWHCCDKQIPRQAGSFASGWFSVCVCEGELFLWQGHNLPCPLLKFVWVRLGRESERGSWLNNSRSTWVKLLIPPKSFQWDLKHTHTHTESKGPSACQCLIKLHVVQLEYHPQCPSVITRL